TPTGWRRWRTRSMPPSACAPMSSPNLPGMTRCVRAQLFSPSRRPAKRVCTWCRRSSTSSRRANTGSRRARRKLPQGTNSVHTASSGHAAHHIHGFSNADFFMHTLTIAELLDGLAQKRFSAEELTLHYLARIERLDARYNSYITVTAEAALEAARAADKARAQNNHGALAGIPIAHKDIFCTNGVRTSCASKMLDNFVPPYDAHVVAKFAQAGAVCLGKTNMDEFAMGSSNETSFYGAVKNPWAPECVPGGSSGGSAAAIAAQLCAAATGTDTGGSIRQPAALCGLTGLKPTYGRVSRYGMIAFASSLDQGGPMTRSAHDAALLMNVMAGFDARDSTSAQEAVPDYTATLNDSLDGLRIGLPKEYFGAGLSPEIESAVHAAIKEFEKLGATVKELSLPNTEL